MKSRMFCFLIVLAVLALMTVSLAQKPYDFTAYILIEPTSVKLGQPVHIELFVSNTGARNVTIREVELYCGTRDQGIWDEMLTVNRLTVESGQTVSFALPDYIPSCAGTWSVQCIMHFGGSGKRDLMTPPTMFTVTE